MRAHITIGVLVFLLTAPAQALSPDQMLRAGQTYAERGSARKAIPLLKRALDSGQLSSPDRAKAELALGMAYAQLDDSAPTIEHLHAALAIDPGLEKAYLLLGMTHDLADRPDLASVVYRRGLDHLPDSPRLQHELGLSELMLGEVGKAVAHLRGAAKRQPANPDLLGDLGYALLRAGRYEDAITALTEAMAYAPPGADLLTHLGDAQAGAGHADKALDAYDRALEIDPDRVRAHFHRGLLLGQQGKLAQAMRSYRQVLRRDPRHRRAQLALAAALSQADRASQKEAQQILRQVLAQDPSFAAAYVGLARIALGHGDLKEARAQATQALERDPGSRSARALMEQVLQKQGDQAALRRYQAAWKKTDTAHGHAAPKRRQGRERKR